MGAFAIGAIAAGAAQQVGQFLDASGRDYGVAEPGEVAAASGVGHKASECILGMCPLPASGLVAVPALDAAVLVVERPAARGGRVVAVFRVDEFVILADR